MVYVIYGLILGLKPSELVVDILQFCLLIAAIWLANETRLLRVKSGEQLTFDKMWRRQQMVPQLSIGVTTDEDGVVALKFRNVSENLGVSGMGFLYDQINHNYRKLRGVRSYLPNSERWLITEFDGERFGLDGLITKFHQQLSRVDSGMLRSAIISVTQDEPERHVVGYVVHDTLHYPYLWLRTFTFEEGEAHYKAYGYTNRPIPLFKE